MLRFTRFLRQGLATLFAFVAVAMLAAGAGAQDKLTIPFAGPLTGPIATYGLEPLHGAILAAEDLNEGGGLKSGPWQGYHLVIDEHDDRGDPQESANIAQQLTLDRDVVVLIGHIFSGNCLSALPIYEPAKLSMVTPICSNPTITEQGYRTALRVVPDDTKNATAQARVATETLGAKKPAVLWANQDYGRGQYEVATAYYKDKGIDFIAEPYNEGETDYNAIISRFKNAGADMIVHLGFYTEAALQRRQANQQGFDVPFFAGAGVISSEFIRLGGEDVEGVLVLDFMKEAMATTQLQGLQERVKAKFDEDFNLYHRNGYDVMNFVIRGLEAATGDSREDVNMALRTVSFRGLNFDIALDEKGNLVVPPEKLGDFYHLKIVKGGLFKDYAP